MITFNVATIRKFGPCYDPTKYLTEDWTGTVLNILDDKRIPFDDRLWVILRTDFISEKMMRLFAVWCARQVQHLMKDERSIAALDFMDAYCENRFLIDDSDWIEGWELERDAAWDAAWAAAGTAARAAARDAAWAAQEQQLRKLILAGIETGDTK